MAWEVAHAHCTEALARERVGQSVGEAGAPPYWLLVALTAVGPTSFQIFLPAIPAIRDGFGVESGTAQLALSLSMFGIAFATLAYGSLADRLGRRPTLIAGMALMAAGSLVCALAPSIWVLIGGRIVQAAGGAAGMVVTRAIVLDVYGQQRAREVMGGLLAAMVVAPLLATPVGGLLAQAVGWRATFGVTVALALLSGLAALRFLPETEPRDLERTPLLAAYRQLLSTRTFDAFAFQGAFAMAAFLVFSTGAPYALSGSLGLSTAAAGLWLAAVSAGFGAGSLLARRLPEGQDDGARVRWGAVAAVLATGLGVALALAGAGSVLALVGPACLFAASIGVTMPAAQTGAIGAVPRLSGTASGLSGFLGTVTGAVASQVAGAFEDGTARPVFVLMALMSALALVAAFWIPRKSPGDA